MRASGPTDTHPGTRGLFVAAKAGTELALQWPANEAKIIERRETNTATGAGNMETAGSVAGLATLLAIGRVRIARVPMQCVRHERHIRTPVARQAGFGASTGKACLRQVADALRLGHVGEDAKSQNRDQNSCHKKELVRLPVGP